MNWTKTSMYSWTSGCGRYRIAVTGAQGRYIYSATFRANESAPYHQLGLFSGADSKANANQAKQACVNHAHKQGE